MLLGSFQALFDIAAPLDRLLGVGKVLIRFQLGVDRAKDSERVTTFTKSLCSYNRFLFSMDGHMKSLEDLIDSRDPALSLVEKMLVEATCNCELLSPSADNSRVLSALQVSTRSTLGAIAYETGGLLIDHGWLRIIGSGHPQLSRNLADWNDGRAEGYLLVADDAVGGFFSINGGALGDDVGEMYYWAPDTLQWEQLEIGYTDFLSWALSDRLATFYDGLRWEGWRSDLQALRADQCFSFFPFLWTREGSIEESRRTIVDVITQFEMNVELASQLDSGSEQSA